MIAEKAGELLEEKIQEILYPFEEAVKDITASVYTKLGIEKRNDW